MRFLALAASATLVTAWLIPPAGLAAPRITLQGSFNGVNGAIPYSALTAAGNGLFYGTTSSGGAYGQGAIYEFNPTTGSITLQDSFNGVNGANPYSVLTAVGNGLFYGTTTGGGANGQGAIYAFNSITGSITLQDSFNGVNGANPYSALTAARNGLFYGTANGGGVDGFGTIYSFDRANGSISLRSQFTLATGFFPFAGLTQAKTGLMYGATQAGGSSDVGTIYAFDPATDSISLEDTFTLSNGAFPYAALTLVGDELFYGTSEFGGASDSVYGNGTVYAFDAATGSISLLDSFTFANGFLPFAALTAAGSGLFYGTTVLGGANDTGTIFAFDSSTGSISLQDSFAADASNGASPKAGLTAAGNGIFYGTTTKGGAYGFGAIFAFDSRNSNPVPGPLPVIGIGAAFGWSRQLRRRVAQASPRKR